jgi:hypothetical protein
LYDLPERGGGAKANGAGAQRFADRTPEFAPYSDNGTGGLPMDGIGKMVLDFLVRREILDTLAIGKLQRQFLHLMPGHAGRGFRIFDVELSEMTHKVGSRTIQEPEPVEKNKSLAAQ